MTKSHFFVPLLLFVTSALQTMKHEFKTNPRKQFVLQDQLSLMDWRGRGQYGPVLKVSLCFYHNLLSKRRNLKWATWWRRRRRRNIIPGNVLLMAGTMQLVNRFCLRWTELTTGSIQKHRPRHRADTPQNQPTWRPWILHLSDGQRDSDGVVIDSIHWLIYN